MMSQEKITIDIHALHLNTTSLRIIDNQEQEIQFKIRKILPRMWKYQKAELENMVGDSAKGDLRISTRTARWLMRDIVKNPLFFLSTLRNSYRLILETNENFYYPLHITTSQHPSKIWISRSVVKSGIAPTNLDESLEYDRLRNPGNFDLLVAFAENAPGFRSNDLFEPGDYELCSPSKSDTNTYLTDFEILEDARVKHGKVATQQNQLIQISNQRFELVRRSPGWVELCDEKFRVFKPHLNVGVVDRAIFFGSNLNWFHFIVECLTRFVPIPLDLVRGTPVVLEASAHNNIRQLCELLTGIAPIVLKPGEELSVKRLIVGRESGVIDAIDAFTRKSQLIEIRNRILDSCPELVDVSVRKVYLRRPARLFRPLQNEKRIVKMLSKYGFISIYPENENIQRLVQILNSAEVVVVESGAAMTNLMFANKTVKVLELHPSDGEFGFWQRFLDIFEIKGVGIVGNRQLFGRKGLAIDGYRIPMKKINFALSELLEKDKP
jgi:hypothetical protein